MSIPGPLRDLLQYRGRKKRSLDGSVPGVNYSRYHRGAHYAGMSQASDLSARLTHGHIPHQTSDYDPLDPEYPTVPGYGVPDPWDAICLDHRMPPIRFEPGPFAPFPRAPTYRRSVEFAEMVDELIEEVRELRAAGQPVPAELAALYESVTSPTIPDSEGSSLGPLTEDEVAGPAVEVGPHVPDPVLDQLAMEMTSVPMTDATVAPSSLMPEPAAMELGPTLDPLESMAGPMSLEALVEQMAPEPMPPPEEPDPYMLMQQQFNQQMQMMDPFNMPGPMM